MSDYDRAYYAYYANEASVLSFDAYYEKHGEPHPEDYDRWNPPQDPPEQEPPEQEPHPPEPGHCYDCEALAPDPQGKAWCKKHERSLVADSSFDAVPCDECEWADFWGLAQAATP